MKWIDSIYSSVIFSKEKTTVKDRVTIFFLLVCLVFSAEGFSQNVGINATGALPATSAMLDIASTNKGLLIPRVALSAANSNAPIGASVISSLLIYNTATAGIAPNNVVPGYYYWDGAMWLAFEISGKNWAIQGNAGTTDGVHFLGTSDDVPLNFRTNNQKAGRVDRLYRNTFFGYTAGAFSGTGIANCAFGDSALYNNNSSQNTAIGKSALRGNASGANNVAVGTNALYKNVSGYSNIAIGTDALYHNTAEQNTACGYRTLYRNTSGINNTAFGWNNLYNNSSGNFNTAIGTSILSANTTGSYNTTMGYFVLTNSNGNFNTAIGVSAMRFNTTGNRNTAIGDSALSTLTTGSNNTGLGYGANVPVVNASNQVRIGNAAITYAGVQVAWTITSDKRWKTEIQPSGLGLSFINALRPVSYVRKNDATKKTEYGFIAQEVETLLSASGVANSGLITKDDEGMLSMRYNDLISPMVKAIQEQQDMIEELKLRNKDLEARLKALEKKQ